MKGLLPFRTLLVAAGLASLFVAGGAVGAVLQAVHAASASGFVDATKVDTYVRTQIDRDRIPGLALGIVRGDQIAHLQGFGKADDSGRSVTPQTPFIIGSTSKSFTGLAVMQLAEAGKIELDAPIQRHPRGSELPIGPPRPRSLFANC